MLDTDTKRRIDTARDILVGKVPDPKSQVEQITIALMYKFMDDIDSESEEFGGRRKFFAYEFARYGWAKLMRSGLGGHETLNLYAEAIAKMPENPGIPPLFRDIFKNAYLPYRDPETLKMFLKVIDEFEYDHSERLGDAYEYLLSVLGSQGDAGQFRTPRHIIDFIVAIVDPKKDETILDPACGTAGFLISSYKHILRTNTDAEGNSTLTPDDKGRLAQNFKGYDISPDMVRLSLVNMYLHGFTDPHIGEYDTLTSEDKWNEFADVILANPPFMSPKGGIKPHKRFSVQSKRSEVLFVDYMAEHLTPNGRAGIIVPEGIIFQSQTAYKQPRKMLVEEYLVAVVSLPAGVFNPYSGVKTSILILDKSLAKQSDGILFIRIESEGTDLAARRRITEKSDLPHAKSEIAEYLQALLSKKPTANLQPTLGLIVAKERIAANGDYNLNGERYQEDIGSSSPFTSVDIGEILEKSGREKVGSRSLPIMSITMKDGLIDQSQKFKKRVASKDISSYKVVFKNELVVGFPIDEGVLGFLTKYDAAAVSPAYGIWRVRPKKRAVVDIDFLEMVLRSTGAIQAYKSKMQGAVSRRRSVPPNIFAKIQIPLPPLAAQKQIVVEIQGYEKVIDGARAVLDNYRDNIRIDPGWPMVELGEICSLGGTITKDVDLTLPYFGGDSIESNTGKLLKQETAQVQQVNGPVYEFAGERLLYSKIRPYLNKLAIVDLRGYCSSDMYPLLPDHSRVHVTYLATYMLSQAFNERIRGYYERASIPKINRAQLFETEIPLPSLEIQQQIVAEIETEQALVDANRKLIGRFEKNIQATLSRVWGENEPAPAQA